MIPLFKVAMCDTAASKVAAVLNSGYIGQGQKVDEFEELLQSSAYLGTKTTPVTVNSCTSAIDLALELIGVQPGDEVIATPQTCFASNVHIIHRHAIIKWADIDPITGLIVPESVERLITSRTKAIIAVNWAGKFCDYKKLKSFGFPVIEDAAHTWDVFMSPVEKPTRGDYICYSFQAIKFLTCGDGGVLIAPDEEKTHLAKMLRWYGLDRTKNQSFRCTQNITKVGFKYHMNDINASIGIANLPLSRNSVIANRHNAKQYIDKVKNPLLTLPEWDPTCSYWLFSMHVNTGDVASFTQYMEKNGVATSPVHYRNDMYDTTVFYPGDDRPGVDKFSQTQICIPVGCWLSTKDKEHIINLLNNFGV
jgi:dTDP-4-amino-4,6-dideoxygalactose transaminase